MFGLSMFKPTAQKPDPFNPRNYGTAKCDAYESHMEWAGHQTVGTASIAATALAALNPRIHHCRIGKIRIKQAA